MTLDELEEQVDGEVRKHAEGCCMDDTWRGLACPYHLGMADGITVAFDALREAGYMPHHRATIDSTFCCACGENWPCPAVLS